MPIQETPTILEVYYCGNCHGIIATTDIGLINGSFPHDCPFCQNSSLSKLPKEEYRNNFPSEMFPSPQNLILERFFQYANNTIELLGAFQNIDTFELFSLQLSNFEGFNFVHILIDNNFKITIQVQNLNGLELDIEQTVPDIATKLTLPI